MQITRVARAKLCVEITYKFRFNYIFYFHKSKMLFSSVVEGNFVKNITDIATDNNKKLVDKYAWPCTSYL